MKRKNKGFSLIEIMVVVAIMGVMLGLVTTNLDSITPSSRLDSAARSMYSSITLGMSQAVMSGKPTKLRYSLSENYYRLFTMNDKNKFEPTEKRFFSRGVKFRDVNVAGDKKYTSGWVEIEISPLGVLAGHVIHLINEKEEESTIEVNPFSGAVTVKSGYFKIDFVEKL